MAKYIGLMSGTSVDAIDAVLVEFNTTGIQVHAVHTHPWLSTLREALLTLTQQTREQSTLHDIATLDVKLGELFAEASLVLLKKSQIPREQVCAIGSPGQTLYHHPEGSPPYTWQLGDPNVIAQMTGIPTVADFRRRDMAAGGQGAPLAPAFHNARMRSPHENRVVLNIGGIANITVLPADESQPVIGFDTGPGNALLDAYAFQQQHLSIDKSGAWAATGEVQPLLLEAMLADPYFAHTLGLSLAHEDVQATLCQFTIISIAQAVLPYNPQRLLVCGGGVHNPLLMDGLAKQLPSCLVESQRRLDKQPGNLPSVTGARQAVVLGSVYI